MKTMNVDVRELARGVTMISGGVGSGKTKTALTQVADECGYSIIFSEEDPVALTEKADRFGIRLGDCSIYPVGVRSFQEVLSHAVDLATADMASLVVFDGVHMTGFDARRLEEEASVHRCARFIFTLTLRESVDSACNCGGPPGHVVGGIHCRS